MLFGDDDSAATSSASSSACGGCAFTSKPLEEPPNLDDKLLARDHTRPFHSIPGTTS
ncbi:hypothetical protein LR48_Vigan01g132500 [Vigna angularis]|uniref:Uncharacterized protein n=1 Tax=Phaseolus angularis TaxID=3914 RepID=A0A0L9TMI6_PHAAN|nr:hypothetical protein LR48_Vigan01g132500 [Vigna angularis]